MVPELLRNRNQNCSPVDSFVGLDIVAPQTSFEVRRRQIGCRCTHQDACHTEHAPPFHKLYVSDERGNGRAEATGVLRALMNASRQSYVPPYYIALVHHGIGEDAETMHWLERGYAERDVRMVFIGSIRCGTAFVRTAVSRPC